MVETDAAKILENLDREMPRLLKSFHIEDLSVANGTLSVADDSDMTNATFGVAALELGERRGMISGYPVLRFQEHSGKLICFHAIERSRKYPDYDETREMTLAEATLLLLVVRHVEPNGRVTKLVAEQVEAMFRKAEETLRSQQSCVDKLRRMFSE